MRRMAVLVLLLSAGPAGASGALSSRTAERALTHRLERYQGFHQVTSTCRRRTAREQRCGWHGRRADGQRWHGRATVRRLKGGTVDVRITSATRG